ncbi:hypothetical protein ACLB2K_007341 [Fragaria x ananassa]
MKALALVCPASISSSSASRLPFRFRFGPQSKSQLRSSRIRIFSYERGRKRIAIKGGVVDKLLLNVFRNKMVQQVGWDSDKPGYDGLIEVANRMMLQNPTNSHAKEAAVRVLISLFPPFLLELYKLLIAPIQGGKIAALMVGQYFLCHIFIPTFNIQWDTHKPYTFSSGSLTNLYRSKGDCNQLSMAHGPCTVNSVDLPDGNSWASGVFVEKCKYLEESKCVGICVNTCKLPTQSFFKDYMGVPLRVEPNFNDYSCQFKFGVLPPLPEDDATLKEPCLAICPNATRRREIAKNFNVEQCPKA